MRPAISAAEPWAGLDLAHLPTHVAIIMDGNRRWAKQRLLPGIAGHRAGRDTLRERVKDCVTLGIPYLTAYAFSTENWKRSAEEVGFLWALFLDTLEREVDALDRNGVRIRFLGEIAVLSEDLKAAIARAEDKTAGNGALNLNIALNYGGRAELISAARRMAEDAVSGRLEPSSIDEAVFESYLYTSGQPDPDLLVRTSGELRISNYLLWQLAYTELYVTETFWPDFGREAFREALLAYQQRERRFGARP